MQKLALNVADLDVQSFDTTPALRDLRCTVRAHQENDTYEAGCTDACTLAATCYSCDTCEDACSPGETIDPGDTADPGRRIILY